MVTISIILFTCSFIFSLPVSITIASSAIDKAEFDYLWIHGLVHLFGYDHKKEKDFLLMKKIEKTFINSVND